MLITHSAVADVVVIGLPDEERGKIVVAAVQPAEGIVPDGMAAATLTAFARAAPGGVKTPQRIDFSDTLPREPTGKLMKRVLREGYLANS